VASASTAGTLAHRFRDLDVPLVLTSWAMSAIGKSGASHLADRLAGAGCSTGGKVTGASARNVVPRLWDTIFGQYYAVLPLRLIFVFSFSNVI